MALCLIDEFTELYHLAVLPFFSKTKRYANMPKLFKDTVMFIIINNHFRYVFIF